MSIPKTNTPSRPNDEKGSNRSCYILIAPLTSALNVNSLLR